MKFDGEKSKKGGGVTIITHLKKGKIKIKKRKSETRLGGRLPIAKVRRGEKGARKRGKN